MQLAVTDLSMGGYGKLWQHRRAYSNRLSVTADVGSGYNWIVDQWPYLIEHPEDDSVAVVRGIRKTLWFDLVDAEYVGRYGAKSTFVHDAQNNLFVLTLPGGEQWKFHDFDQTEFPLGLLASQVTAGGQVTEVASYTEDDHIEELRRSVSVNGQTHTQSFFYTYFDTGRVESVTLRDRVGSGDWDERRRVLYQYYGEEEEHGSDGDLKRARIQVPDANGPGWIDSDIHYYRYYKSGEAKGFQHGLKYVVPPSAYALMLTDEVDPLTASDAVLAQYAKYYFEYDEDRRVNKETVDAGARSFTFDYIDSENADDYHNWKRKTVETRADGSQMIVYTNFIGQILIRDFASGDDHWIEHRKFNGDGREILRAQPSAVSGYDDSQADLNVSLKANDGLIHVTDYYATTGNGAAEGYVQFQKIQNGAAGTEIKQSGFEYAQHSAGGITVHPVSKLIAYRNDDGTGEIETEFTYTWHAGTVQMEEQTTTLPVVPESQNGSGTAATRKEFFDEHGYNTWRTDERDFITRFEYDLATGALVREVGDVDTAVETDHPAGWSTPSGGGLNLVSDFQHDALGRQTQSLGPEHTVDIGGTPTDVRSAAWTVYDDPAHETRTGRGYATGAAPNYTFTLVNPVSITKRDANGNGAPGGNVTEEIQAVRPATAGKLQPTDDFPQSSYVGWTTHQYIDGCLPASLRVYHDVPDEGEGQAGANYDQSTFGYDSMKRRNRTVSPGGTITFDVLDVRGQIVKTYVGTDDSGATETDPTGGGAEPNNNMVLVSENEFDNGTDGGDGNRTKETQHVDGFVTRVTTYLYDFRNRRIDTDGELDFYQIEVYDNLNRIVQTDRRDTTDTGNLVSRSETKFDNRGRVYQTVRHGVDPDTGTVGNNLTDNTWFDAAGNPIKQQPAGSALFTKRTYDSLGRPTKQYLGYDLNETSYADAFTVVDDVILEQTEIAYDDGSNVIQTTTRQRYHNAPDTQTGELKDPSTTPKARVTYQAMWPDAVGRQFAMADYGTNGGSALTRPDAVPNRSDTVLVTTLDYDDAGNQFRLIDPADTETRTEFDGAGRRTKLIDNYVDGNPATGDPDEDRTTEWTYTADGAIATLTAINDDTGAQLTTYVHGTTLADSEIATSHLLRRIKYPDSTGDSDSIEYKYNRQSQRIESKDQRGTVHTFDYDTLGRTIHDRVTTLGSGVDGRVRRITTTYEVRGMIATLTSHDNAAVGQGDVVNQCQFQYNDFGQLVIDFQEHDGAVNTSMTPKVEYAYADGSDNTIRPTGITYPDGRVITYDYGASGGMDDAASRIASIVDDDTTHLTDYSYLGQGTIVIADRPEPQVKFTLVDLNENNDPDTGDIYSGLDRFGRVKDNRWHDYDDNQDVDRIKHGYDRAGNRLWRENVVAASQNKDFDELYEYDGLHRLADMQRGQLNAQKDGIESGTLAFRCPTSARQPVGQGSLLRPTRRQLQRHGRLQRKRKCSGTLRLLRVRPADVSRLVLYEPVIDFFRGPGKPVHRSRMEP